MTSVGRGVERGIFSWMSHRSSSLFCATLAVGLLDQRVQDSGPAPVSRHKWQRDRTAMHCCELCAFSCKLPHQRMHACIHTPSRRLAEKPQNSASIYSRKNGLYVCTSGVSPLFQAAINLRFHVGSTSSNLKQRETVRPVETVGE